MFVCFQDGDGDFDKDELPLEDTPINNDAFQALKSLGFTPSIIKEVINKVLLKNNNLMINFIQLRKLI